VSVHTYKYILAADCLWNYKGQNQNQALFLLKQRFPDDSTPGVPKHEERKFCIKYVWLDGLNSSPCSQTPAIGPYREPNELRHLPSLFLCNPLNIIFTAMLRVFQVDSSLQISPQKPCTHFSFPHKCHTTHPSPPQGMISLTISGNKYTSRSFSLIIFISLLLLPSS